MTLFAYKAVAASGDVVEGEMEAHDKAAVIALLHARGFVPIRADEVASRTSGRWLRRELWGGRQVSPRDVAMLTREMATLLSAGLPLDRALEILGELAANDTVKKLVRQILDRVRGGSALADAIAAHGDVFPRSYVSTVQAGEAGGSLDTVLARLAISLEKSLELRETVKSALIYPAVLLFMAGVSVVVLLAVVIPEFSPLFEDAGAALPLSTRILVVVGSAVQQYWWLMAIAAAGLVVLIRRQLQHPARRLRWDGWLLRSPVLGDLVAKVEMARFSRTLGTLLGNGVPLLSGVIIAKEVVENTVIAKAIDVLATSLKEGRGMADPLVMTDVFPKVAMQLIRVGEESGQLEDMLIKVADIYDREVQLALDRALALLVPALTIALGILVAGIIMAILSAILSVYDLPF